VASESSRMDCPSKVDDQLNRSTRDWYTHPAAARVCSLIIFSTAAVIVGSS
jgi:hypothetical protein